MQRRVCVVLLTILGLAAVAAGADSKDQPTPEHVARLIHQLGSDRFDDRQAASAELDKLGAPALEALKAACNSQDAEIRHRAERVRQTIEKRLETARLLTPRKIHLVYKDIPLTDAVADLSKKSGIPIQLDGDKDKLAKRRITLDTGEVPFWTAFDQFCEQAGVTEQTVPATSTEAGLVMRRQVLLQQQVLVWQARSGRVRRAHQLSGCILRDGKHEPVPTFVAGALRVRALPAEARLIVQSTAERDVVYRLEVAAEPGMELLRVLPPRISRAEDDKGLVLSGAPVAEEAPATGNQVEELLILEAQAQLGNAGATAHHVSTRLRLRDAAARKITTFAGSVLVEVRTPPIQLATIPDILQAGGKSFPADDGGSIKIGDVKREGDRLQLRVTVDSAPVGDVAVARNVAWMMLANQKQDPGSSEDEATGLALYDTTGKRIKGRVASTEIAGAMIAGQNAPSDYTLTYQLEKNQKPARLVFTGRRNAILDVPFVLKDVPVPGK